MMHGQTQIKFKERNYNLIQVILTKGYEITNVFYYFHPMCRMGILSYKSQTDGLIRLNVSFLWVNRAMDIDSLTKFAANNLLQTTRQIGRQVGKSGTKLIDRSIED